MRSSASSEMQPQRGAALILVLMVVGVVGLLLLSVSLSVRSQVIRAQALLDRASLLFQERSIESELAFVLLTRDLVAAQDEQETVLPPIDWNFVGRPFEHRNAKISVQDVGGLFVSPQKAEDAQDFEILFETLLGIESDAARAVSRRLEVKMREPSWVAIQSLQDADFSDLIGEREQRLLDRFVVLSPETRFNPLAVPDELLPIWFGASDVEAIRALRKQSAFDAQSYEDLMGPMDEFTVTYPGPQFRVAIRVQQGSTTQIRSAQWIIDPYSEQPWSVFFRKRGADAFQ